MKTLFWVMVSPLVLIALIIFVPLFVIGEYLDEKYKSVVFYE